MCIKCLNNQYLQGVLRENMNLKIIDNCKIQEKILTLFCRSINSLIMNYAFYR